VWLRLSIYGEMLDLMSRKRVVVDSTHQPACVLDGHLAKINSAAMMLAVSIEEGSTLSYFNGMENDQNLVYSAVRCVDFVM
jgi:hypothetical protein